LTPDISSLLILLLTGFAAGVLAGLFGVGGGIIIVPVLLMIYSNAGVSPEYMVQTAIATSLFTIIFTTIASSYRHYRHQNVIPSAALIIGISSSIAVLIFSKIAIDMSGDVLKKIFSGILVLIALRMILERNENPVTRNVVSSAETPFRLTPAALIGILSGIVAAFSGLGGGIFIVPLMVYLLKFPLKKAIGTSSAAILLTAISGVLGYFLNAPAHVYTGEISLGLVDVSSAIPLVVASVPASQLGVFLHRKISRSLLRILFALFVIVVSAKVLFF
jgi:uncharacterized membrane protein YfcA